MSFSPGQRIGDYEVLGVLGAGGMGRLYKVRNVFSDRIEAMKVLLPELAQDPAIVGRFRQEIQVQARLIHPNIATLYAATSVDNQFLMLMEFVEGVNLDRVLAKGPLPFQEAVDHIRQVLSALEFAHKLGVVHRDVKPANMMLTKSGVIKLLDFGIARFHNDRRLTMAGTTLGSVSYMSPEQIMGKAGLDSRSDLYSAGVSLYEIVTGRRPFDADSDFETMSAIIQTDPKPPIELSPAIPRALNDAILTSIARAPEQRFQTAAAFIKALDFIRPPEVDVLPEEVNKPQGWWLSGVLKSLAETLGFRPASPDFPPTPEIREDGPTDAASPTLPQVSLSAEPSPAAPPPPPKQPGEFTRLFQQGLPPPSREPVAPPASSAAPEFTRLFQTAPPQAGTESPALPAGASEATGVFTIHQAPVTGTRPSRTVIESTLPDVALTITACADRTRIGRNIKIDRFPFRLGREGALSFDEAISREHAEIQFSNGGFLIRDLGSANGTYVNGKQVRPAEPEPLMFGSRILLGSNTQLTFVSNELEELPDLTGLLIGGRYTLSSRLFPSAKSAFYIGAHRDLKGPVVIKILSPKLARHPGYREQFEHEAKMASELRHESIAQVFDYGETELGPDHPGSLYMVLEYFEGGNLRDRLARNERSDLAIVSGWLSRLAEGLDYVHGQQVVHGGIKPTAIVFDSADHAYLTDFATAVTTRDRTRRSVVGTPPFLAPEQWDGREWTQATDQYALAAVFYLATTGAYPYEGQEQPDIRARNYLRPPVPAHEIAAQNLRTAMTPAASAVLARAIALDPSARYASVGEFASAFRIAVTEKAADANRKPVVFLSYHRDLSLPWAIYIQNELERDHNCDVFVDVAQRDMAGEIPEHLERNIERCDVLMCLLSRNTLKSAWVNLELESAFKKTKPMIPVFQESFVYPRDLILLPPHVQKLLRSNGAKLYDKKGDYIPATVEKLSGLIRQLMDVTRAPRPSTAP